MSQNVDYSAELGQAAKLLAPSCSVAAFAKVNLFARLCLPELRSTDVEKRCIGLFYYPCTVVLSPQAPMI